MASSDPPRIVAVLDSDPDTTELLKTVLELEGFVVALGSLIDFRLGKQDLAAFLARTQPDVIVYDLGLPYDVNWHYLQAQLERPEFARCGLVITTTNERAVAKLVTLPVVEIHGKPYDLTVLIDAVRNAHASNRILMPDSPEVHERRTGRERRHEREEPPVH